MQEIRLGNIYGATGGNFAGNVYDENGCCPTIRAVAGSGGNQQPMWIEVKQATKEGTIPCKIGGWQI